MSRRERLHVDDGDARQITSQRRGRLISCPNCMRIFESMRRFQLQCPQCGHAWQERSNRNLIDWVKEQPANLAGGLMWVIPVVWLLGFVLVTTYLIARTVDGQRNVLLFALLAGVLLVLVTSVVLAGRTRDPPYR